MIQRFLVSPLFYSNLVYSFIFIHSYFMNRFANEFEFSILGFLFYIFVYHKCLTLRGPVQMIHNG